MCVYRFNNVQIPKPVVTGNLSCQAAFALQQGQPVIAGSTVVENWREIEGRIVCHMCDILEYQIDLFEVSIFVNEFT